jgi:hypothetical protein
MSPTETVENQPKLVQHPCGVGTCDRIARITPPYSGESAPFAARTPHTASSAITVFRQFLASDRAVVPTIYLHILADICGRKGIRRCVERIFPAVTGIC